MTGDPQGPLDLRKKNGRILIGVFATVTVMVGLSFAAVPLYNLFCRVTGFGGTTQVSNAAPDESRIVDRVVDIRFNTSTGRNMLWRFTPDQRSIKVRIGQQALASFSVENIDSVPVTGTALYNVTPDKAGKYFQKTECFCFQEQTVQPGGKIRMPVVFYIDPAMADDPNLKDVHTITLSYSYFKAETPELDTALNQFFSKNGKAAAQKPDQPPKEAYAGTVALPPKKQ